MDRRESKRGDYVYMLFTFSVLLWLCYSLILFGCLHCPCFDILKGLHADLAACILLTTGLMREGNFQNVEKHGIR